MNSNPIGATSWWDPRVKTARIVIILVFETQNEVSTYGK